MLRTSCALRTNRHSMHVSLFTPISVGLVKTKSAFKLPDC